MIEVPISDKVLLAARAKAVEMGEIRRSILKGGGNLAGFVGEFVAAELIGGEVCNTFDYDILLDDGTKIDVKSKMTSVEPKKEYDCSIPESQKNSQKCDRYIFVRVKNDFSVAWVLGQKDKLDFFRDARLVKKGDVDESNGFRCKWNCYNLLISELDEL